MARLNSTLAKVTTAFRQATTLPRRLSCTGITAASSLTSDPSRLSPACSQTANANVAYAYGIGGDGIPLCFLLVKDASPRVGMWQDATLPTSSTASSSRTVALALVFVVAVVRALVGFVCVIIP